MIIKPYLIAFDVLGVIIFDLDTLAHLGIK